MTINDAREGLTVALGVLDRLAAAVGGEKTVLDMTMRDVSALGTTPPATPEIFLDEPTMQAVVAAFPDIDTSLVPLGDDFGAEHYWAMKLAGVNVFTLMEVEDK